MKRITSLHKEENQFLKKTEIKLLISLTYKGKVNGDKK